MLTKAYDQNYAIDAITDSATGGLSIDVGLDAVGNVTALDERLATGATASRAVGYDGLDRLASLDDGATPVQAFGYDATGNRTSKTTGGTTTGYTYPTTSHRLTGVGA